MKETGSSIRDGRLAVMLAITAGALLRSNVGRHKEPFRFPPRVSHSVRATVEAFARAYEEASRDRELHPDNAMIPFNLACYVLRERHRPF
jgi:hypothetical protein